MSNLSLLSSPNALSSKIDTILGELADLERIVVAFSGGVDSSVVAALAYRALGAQAMAATAVSETLAERELEEAVALAHEIGIQHELVAFRELDNDDFVANTPARCFFCQNMRFEHMRAIAARLDCDVVASGSNYSDLGDHRPGLEAMKQLNIYQPLLIHKITKNEVREIAKSLNLSVWDKPAKACLSSRIPYGIEVTQQRLARIEVAEEVLHQLGFQRFRVRDHNGRARIEIGTDEMDTALQPHVLRSMKADVLNAGFDSVSLDMIGFRSGSLNPKKMT